MHRVGYDQLVLHILFRFIGFSTTISRLVLQVKHWVTIYEPATIAYAGYGIGVYAPGLNETGTAPYIVGHNLLKAHVRVYKMYQAEFKASQNGKR